MPMRRTRTTSNTQLEKLRIQNTLGLVVTLRTNEKKKSGSSEPEGRTFQSADAFKVERSLRPLLSSMYSAEASDSLRLCRKLKSRPEEAAYPKQGKASQEQILLKSGSGTEVQKRESLLGQSEESPGLCDDVKAGKCGS